MNHIINPVITRKQRILSVLEDICKTQTEGVTTSYIAEKLNLSRANVSNELNILVKEKIVSKSDGRPVLYSIKSTRLIDLSAYEDDKLDPFIYLIGHHSSLKESVKQAKAAIMYPPFGLHTIITGHTGVGKSLFAKLMYNYAIANKRLAKNKPFIVFNCSDYANNPQLLISHIFGYVKGAFTGATHNKQGLIAEADGGMLFLDEIHRLPPEGQEMIFYFMDTGSYSLLGETQRNNKSQVLLICATTEDPDSTLLATFLRRIPIKINLPDLDRRTPQEQVELLRFIFENESQRIQASIEIDCNSAKAILGASSVGNVGKLKSNIQTICALALVEQGVKNNLLTIHFENLPSELKVGLFNFKRDKEYQLQLNQSLNNGVMINYNQDKHNSNAARYDNSYLLPLDHFINNKIQFMLDNHFSEQEMNNLIIYEVNQYVNLSNYMLQDHGVDERIINFCQMIKSELELQLTRAFSTGFVFSLAYHIDNIIKNNGKPSQKAWAKNYNVTTFATYDAALLLKKRLHMVFNLEIDEDEVLYLAILISSLTVYKDQNPIHIIVAAHGNMIATEMVNIAKALIGENSISAVNMPLDIKPQQAILQIKKAVTQITNVQGILLLVDMGSLKQTESLITSDLNIPIKTLDMVSTPLVIEALRKSAIVNIELNELYLSLKHFKGYGAPDWDTQNESALSQKPYAILVICSSGEGIAQKLKSFLQLTLEKNKRHDIFVLNVSIDYMEKNRAKIMMEYKLLATIGVMDPKLSVPHLSLDELLSLKGDFLLQTILGNTYQKPDQNLLQTATTIAEVYLQDFLVFLNPKKILPIVDEFVTTLKEQHTTNQLEQIMLNAYVHISCALERSLKKEPIEYKKNKFNYDDKIIQIYHKAAQCFKLKLNIELDDNELFYIMDMFEKNQENL